MAANRYRKKPVVIEAFQWTGGAVMATAVINWVLNNDGTARWHEDAPAGEGAIGRALVPANPEHIAVDTLEGTMRADIGDFIIRGVKGEFYPCKPDIFAATYDEVAT